TTTTSIYTLSLHDALPIYKRKLASIKTEKKKIHSVSEEQKIQASTPSTEYTTNHFANINLDQVITYLNNLKAHDMDHLETLKRENTSLKSKTYELEEKLLETKSKLKTIQSDYQYFLNMMEKARQLTSIHNQQENSQEILLEQAPNMEQIIEESN